MGLSPLQHHILLQGTQIPTQSYRISLNVQSISSLWSKLSEEFCVNSIKTKEKKITAVEFYCDYNVISVGADVVVLSF